MKDRWSWKPSFQDMKEIILNGTLTSTFNVEELKTMQHIFELLDQVNCLRQACDSQIQEIYEGPCITTANQELIDACQKFDKYSKRNK